MVSASLPFCSDGQKQHFLMEQSESKPFARSYADHAGAMMATESFRAGSALTQDPLICWGYLLSTCACLPLYLRRNPALEGPVFSLAVPFLIARRKEPNNEQRAHIFLE